MVRSLNYAVINMDGELERNAEEIFANLSTASRTSLVDRFAIGLTVPYVSTCFFWGGGLPSVCVFNCFFFEGVDNAIMISRTLSLH